MARAKVATQRGLNMEPSKTLTRTLAKAYDRTDLVARRAARRLLPDAVRSRDPAQIGRAIAAIQAEVDAAMPKELLQKLATRAGTRQNEIARKAFFPALSRSTGFNIIGNDDPLARDVSLKPRRGRKTLVVRPNVQPQLMVETFVGDNVALMTGTRDGISRGMATRLAEAGILDADDPTAAMDALLKTWTKDGVPTQVGQRTVSTKKHARLIARDQIEKLNGQLGETRQRVAGVEKFSWQTQQDDRVRAEHEELQGKIFTWAEGSNGIFPGQPINCRCWPGAVVDKDKILSGEGFIEVGSIQAA